MTSKFLELSLLVWLKYFKDDSILSKSFKSDTEYVCDGSNGSLSKIIILTVFGKMCNNIQQKYLSMDVVCLPDIMYSKISCNTYFLNNRNTIFIFIIINAITIPLSFVGF